MGIFAAFEATTGRLHAAFTDPARRERNIVLALAAYALVWTLYGTIAKSSQGLHFDMVEQIAWSRDLAWGFKHPPLAAAIVWLWFEIFPVAEWSYYLLAMLMAAIALWIVWRLSADYLDIEKRVVGLALLMLVPFFNFHALKYNVNTVLLPLWAATTFWFLRSYTRRNALYAALAGLAAAGCMLGKYWSVFLIGGLIAAALVDRRRAHYFRSPAPWITVLVGLAVLTPHLLWLYRNDFEPFGYAMQVHGAKPFAATAIGVLGYLAGSVGYVAVPLILVFLFARPSRATLADMIWPEDKDRRLVAAAFWGPLLLPAAAAVVSGTEITSLWSMSAWTLLPVMLLSPPAITTRANDTRRLLAAVVVLPLVMLLAAPAIAIVVHRKGAPLANAQAALLAAQIERAWHAVTPHPLRYVGGNGDIAFSVISYAADRPRALPGMPRPGTAELARSGFVLVCLSGDEDCLRAAAAQVAPLAPGSTVTVTVRRDFLGWPGRQQDYAVGFVPPQR